MSDEPPEVVALLGKSKKQWDALVAFAVAHPGVVAEWKRYAAQHGWQLKLVAKKRALAYLIPKEGHFTAAAALRPPAIAALREHGFSEEFVRAVEAAKEAPEGRPARVEVSGPRDLGLAKKLLEIKLV